jgi:hypothetical protein
MITSIRWRHEHPRSRSDGHHRQARREEKIARRLARRTVGRVTRFQRASPMLCSAITIGNCADEWITAELRQF